MKAPRITVLVPTHNRAGFLREALASVVEQSVQDLSIVVADNASADDTADVVSSFSDPRIRYVRHPHDIGYVRNFNFCLGQIDAGCFTFLHDDDYMLPGRLEATLRVLDDYPNHYTEVPEVQASGAANLYGADFRFHENLVHDYWGASGNDKIELRHGYTAGLPFSVCAAGTSTCDLLLLTFFPHTEPSQR